MVPYRFRSPFMPAVALLCLLVAFALTIPGCQALGLSSASANPFGACKSSGQCYLAAAGTYAASQQAALTLLKDPSTPTSVKDGLKKADAAAAPVMGSLAQAYAVYRHAKADLAAGTSSPEKVAIATADLNKWLTDAGPLIANLSKLAGS